MSCANGHWPLCAPDAQRRVPMIQAATLPLHPILTGASPGLPGQPQEHTPVDGPYPEVGIKPQLSSRVRMTKEEEKKFSINCKIGKLNPHIQLNGAHPYGRK